MGTLSNPGSEVLPCTPPPSTKCDKSPPVPAFQISAGLKDSPGVTQSYLQPTRAHKLSLHTEGYFRPQIVWSSPPSLISDPEWGRRTTGRHHFLLPAAVPLRSLHFQEIRRTRTPHVKGPEQEKPECPARRSQIWNHFLAAGLNEQFSRSLLVEFLTFAHTHSTAAQIGERVGHNQGR